MPQVKFRTWTCNIKKATYPNGRVGLRLLSVGDGSPIAVATVNIPDVKLPEGYVFIKDWSENTGMLKCLVEAGIVEDTGQRIPTGFVEAAVCKLLI